MDGRIFTTTALNLGSSLRSPRRFIFCRKDIAPDESALNTGPQCTVEGREQAKAQRTLFNV